jgi:hypothetical protein
MEAELITLISLFGMIVLCSGMLAIIKSDRLCNIARITPLVVVGEHSRNIPPVVGEHSRNIPPVVGEHSRNVPPAENPDVLENV